MFATLKSAKYGIEAILTDNGPEMASPRNIEGHPMERKGAGHQAPLHPAL